MRGIEVHPRAARRPGRPRRLHLLRRFEEAGSTTPRHKDKAFTGVTADDIEEVQIKLGGGRHLAAAERPTASGSSSSR